MKRLVIGFLVVIITLIILVSCTSDDDDDNGIVLPDNALFELVISAPFGRDGDVELYILDSENPADSCALLIDGEAIELTLNGYGTIWSASYAFEASRSYNLDLTINGGAFHGTADVKIPLCPVANYPETWDGQDDLEITWTLDENSTAQAIHTMGPDEYAFTTTDIEPEDRSYVVPAGLHGFEGETWQVFTLMIEENNWDAHDRIIFSAKSFSVIEYDIVEEIVEPPSSGWTYAITAGCFEYPYGYIYIYALDYDDIIEACTLLIDGEEVAMIHYTESNDWFGEYPFEEGVSYNFDLTINNTLHQSTDLVVPYIPIIDSPETWDGQTNYELTWELDQDSKSQSLFIYGPDDEYRSIGSIYIYASLRSYLLQANLHGYNDEDTEYLSISVDQENWVSIGGLLFISFTNDYADFGSYRQTEAPRDHARRILRDVTYKME